MWSIEIVYEGSALFVQNRSLEIYLLQRGDGPAAYEEYLCYQLTAEQNCIVKVIIKPDLVYNQDFIF